MLRMFSFTREYSTAKKIIDLLEICISNEVENQNDFKKRDIIGIGMNFLQKLQLKVKIGDMLKKYIGSQLYDNYQMLSPHDKLAIREQIASTFYLNIKSATNNLAELDIAYVNVYDGFEEAVFSLPNEFLKKDYLESRLQDCLEMVKEKLFAEISDASITHEML